VKVDTRAEASAGEVCNAASTSLCASCATGTVSKQGAASVPAIGDRKDSRPSCGLENFARAMCACWSLTFHVTSIIHATSLAHLEPERETCRMKA
jgi:hypothetical protein